MAITDIDKYYYFKLHNGTEYAVKVTAIRINTAIMTMYRELTAEQVEFYLANPTATIQEVMNCALTPPYVPPAPDVQEYASMRVKELKDACYSAITVDELQYAMANAVLAGTSIAYAGKKHYSTSKAIAIMKQFMDESDKAVTVYETYKPQIESASNIEAIDTLYNQAITEL